MEPFNYGRLDLARRLQGMSKGDLASSAGVSPRALHLYAVGDIAPSPETVAALASAVAFPPGFFFGPDLIDLPSEAASFRAMTRITTRLRETGRAFAIVALSVSDWIEDRFTLPPASVPRLDSIDPEAAAAAVRSEWGLGERPIRNMIHLLELHGIRVFSLAEDCMEMDAFSFWADGRPFVFLNTVKSPEHRRFDAAHELGHLVLHTRGTRDRLDEHAADQFASAFLMPQGDLLAQAPRNATLEGIIRAKRRWNVSVAALTYRMHTLGLLTDWRYRSLFKEISKRGYRKVEPDSGTPERSQILDKVFAQLRTEGVSQADVARALDLPSWALAKIVFGLVVMPVGGNPGAAQTSIGPAHRPTLRII